MSNRCFTQAAAVRKHSILKPACHVPPGVSLWAKSLPDCRCLEERRKGRERRILSRTEDGHFPSLPSSWLAVYHVLMA